MMFKIYNTLTRKVEEFIPINPPNVGIYSCGPTVYDYQHIGHMRRYVGDDLLIRVLKFNNFKVHHVMNITDVGHLTSDADTGEDKMEKGAEKYGLSVWDIAKKFEKQFIDSAKALNIELPKDLMHATDFIDEQIELIKKLEEKGFTYKTADGIYFDTSRFPDYFKLSRQNPEELKGGVRIDLGGKKNISDFALWKFSSEPSGLPRRQMEWWFEGPLKGELSTQKNWSSVPVQYRETVGFPGWHIECSAMSMEALGESFDIHTGGIDHINIHHSNEIAQSEAATGKPFVKYFVHHAFLQVESEKMSKSLGNFYTVADIEKKGFDPLSLRYLYLQTHYRQEMNFTWEALEGAQTALNKLRGEFASWGEAKVGCAEFEQRFKEAINDDLNLPEALSVMWEMVRSNYPGSAKKRSLLKFDEVLRFGLAEFKPEKVEVPDKRKKGGFSEADKIRVQIEELGFTVEDTPTGTKIKKLNR
ncbi:MAG: cysteine--tRNA ligase [Candidatus Levybacteria bacterium]|nr:cysteine--tRNA ligase [Candidatus Levybacteria bacterium]